jgi:hypothetical protein
LHNCNQPESCKKFTKQQAHLKDTITRDCFVIENNLETLQQETTSTVTFTILADPESSVYPPPVELASWLNKEGKKARMKAAFTNFDSSFIVTPIEFKRYTVDFSTKPAVLNVSYDQVNITVNLGNYGYVYATAVKKDEDLGKPSSFQVASGLSYQNVPLPSNYTEIDQKFVAFNLTVSYLEADTGYNLYVTAGSAHPGYPDLMNDTSVIFLEFTTLKAPEKPRLSIESGNIFRLSSLAIAALAFLYILA